MRCCWWLLLSCSQWHIGACVACWHVHTCAGDHLQLPPTVLSDAAAKAGLSCTLFERLQHSLGDAASSMLTVQYRMHSHIMDWSSQELYEVSSTEHNLACCMASMRYATSPPDPPVIINASIDSH